MTKQSYVIPFRTTPAFHDDVLGAYPVPFSNVSTLGLVVRVVVQHEHRYCLDSRNYGNIRNYGSLLRSGKWKSGNCGSVNGNISTLTVILAVVLLREKLSFIQGLSSTGHSGSRADFE